LYQGTSSDVPHLVVADKEASFGEARISVETAAGAKARIFCGSDWHV
jgi:hypothetical protein